MVKHISIATEECVKIPTVSTFFKTTTTGSKHLILYENDDISYIFHVNAYFDTMFICVGKNV